LKHFGVLLQNNVANTLFPDPAYLESSASNPDPAHRAITQALRLLDWVKVPGHWWVLLGMRYQANRWYLY
jgi:hypothetical protein